MQDLPDIHDRPVILVTGSSGLIGSAVIERLSPPYRIAGLDRVGPDEPQPQAECILVDLASDEAVEAALDRVRHAYGTRITSVIHLAAYYDFAGDESDRYDEITVEGTRRLLRGLRSFNVEQFVLSSTMLLHAPTSPGRPITEDSPVEAKWEYPESKVDAERVLREERGAMKTVALRIAGVYTDQCQSIPLAHQIKRIYERKLIGRVFPGEIGHGQSFVHLDDVVEAIRLVVEERDRLPAETVLLIGEEETLSYDELQRSFSLLIDGEPWETRQIPKAVAKTGAWLQDVLPGEEPFIKPWMIDLADDHYELDVTRARELIGWQPTRSLRRMIPTLVAALHSDPVAFYRENGLEAPSWLGETRPDAQDERTLPPMADGPDLFTPEAILPPRTAARPAGGTEKGESVRAPGRTSAERRAAPQRSRPADGSRR